MKVPRPKGFVRFLGKAFLSAIAAGAMIVVPAIGANAANAADAAASDAVSCVTQTSSLIRLTGDADDPVRNPVLLVHGWLSTAMPETHTGPRPVTAAPGIASSPFARPVKWSSDGGAADDVRSLQERLAELPDTSVFAFDYSSVAALWIGHSSTAAALAGAIECLADASGTSVDIVAHSMGGLALRDALGGSDGGVTAHVGEIVTVATPYEGSGAASALAGLGAVAETAFSSASVLANIAVPAFVGICNRELESDARVGCDIPPSVRTVLAIAGDGGRALQAGSVELATLPDWPAAARVHAIAADYRIQVTTAIVPADVFTVLRDAARGVGLELSPLLNETIAVGDGIVEVPSATAGASSAFVARCDVSIDLATVGGTERFEALTASVGGLPPFAGPCAHDSLFENDDVVDDIVAVLGADR